MQEQLKQALAQKAPILDTSFKDTKLEEGVVEPWALDRIALVFGDYPDVEHEILKVSTNDVDSNLVICTKVSISTFASVNLNSSPIASTSSLEVLVSKGPKNIIPIKLLPFVAQVRTNQEELV